MQDGLAERKRRQRETSEGHAKGGRSRLVASIGPCQSILVRLLPGRYVLPTPFAMIYCPRPSCRLLGSIDKGAAIGVNAALISVITEWLSDLKMGHCAAGWWLNQKFCCWEIEVEGQLGCEDWLPWTDWGLLHYTTYVLLAVRRSHLPQT